MVFMLSLFSRYDTQLKHARKTGARKGIVVGFLLGGTFFIIFILYGVGFWFGAFLIQDFGAQGGNILTAFFTVLIASFTIGQAVPNIESLLTAAGAAVTVYDTIDRVCYLHQLLMHFFYHSLRPSLSPQVPPIDSSSPDGLKPEKFDPVIELRNVSFTYPTRPDVQVSHV